ncbi:MAG: NTP transferase domain-containing protein [Bacteroidota bacterium]
MQRLSFARYFYLQVPYYYGLAERLDKLGTKIMPGGLVFEMKKNLKADIKGIVLAGGRSKRMGKDKGLIDYHGKPQRIYCYELLKNLGLSSVHISCREDQEEELSAFGPIIDPPGRSGPIFILENAFQLLHDSALMLIPCDVPLIDKKSLEFLVANRNLNKIATAFLSPFDHKPEPLLAIWEPSSLDLIQSYIQVGNFSPRKLLMEADAHVIEAPFPQKLRNVNTPEEAEEIKRFLEE